MKEKKEGEGRRLMKFAIRCSLGARTKVVNFRSESKQSIEDESSVVKTSFSHEKNINPYPVRSVLANSWF